MFRESRYRFLRISHITKSAIIFLLVAFVLTVYFVSCQPSGDPKHIYGAVKSVGAINSGKITRTGVGVLLDDGRFINTTAPSEINSIHSGDRVEVTEQRLLFGPSDFAILRKL